MKHTLPKAWPAWITRLLAFAVACVIAGATPTLAMDAGISDADPQSPSHATNLGSYEVAPVRILGIPSIVVASPQLHDNGNVVAATQRAELIEGNLRLLYAPQGLCSQAEQLAEQLLEGLVLGGPQAERLCSGDPWGVSWAADQLRLETKPGPIGSVVIQARLPGRPVPLPLLTVTAADGQLYGLQPEQLAQQWRQLLQRRLIHARRTMQPDQLQLRWRVSALLAVLLVGSIVLTMRWWTQLRQRLGRFQSESRSNQHAATRRPKRLLWLSRLVFTALLLEILVLGSLLAAATPGGIPLALALLMQPLEILLKGLAAWAVVQALRLMLRILLRQWRSNPDVPLEQLERRRQRYTNLMQAGQRLVNLAGAVVLLIWVITGIPGINATPLSTWLAGGALLGALAFVFQGLLRDFVAGLVTLLEDHYAVDDWVEVEGLEGTVEDVGILATVLRCVDQRVMVIPNSRCDRLINHTRLRSGVDLLIPLPPAHPQLERALAVVGEEADRFAADPHWQPLLLQPPVVRGVKRITPVAVELSVLLQTHTGDQWAAERELLGRIVRRFETEGLLLAQQLAINQPG